LCKRLGIYGGTFDPIHTGHLILAEMTRQECGLDKVVFIPAANPPHKRDRYISSPMQRLEMTRLAIEDNPHFELSDMEIKRKGISYTVDTLKALRDIYPEECEFWMIIGSDSLLELNTWKDIEKITQMCNFAVYMRPDSPVDRCKAQAQAIGEGANGNITFVQAPMIEISSTDIREKVAKGKSIRYMVTDRVRQYIMDRGLYNGRL